MPMTNVPAPPTTRYWIAVVSHAHVQGGVAGGFAQLCHGKERPLRRMHSGDWLVYYSPRSERQGGVPIQAFTAIGQVVGEDAYPIAMSEAFVPFRRDVRYLPCRQAAIEPLLDRLSFIKDKIRWGYPFRAGHFEIAAADFALIAKAMRIATGVADGEAVA